MKTKNTAIVAAMALIFVLSAMELDAQDWPRWRGANNDGISTEAGLNLDWATKQPSQAWVFREAGMGYSAPTVAGGTLYCQGAVDKQGFAWALDTGTGTLKWKQALGTEEVGDREQCPRGSVTVDGDRLYMIQGNGRLNCLSAADGKEIWQKEFKADLDGKIMSGWGYCESPLVDGNLVVCTPGGAKGMMVALDKKSGAEVWRSSDWTDAAGYSSPVAADVDGIRQYIQQSDKGVAGVSAKDGRLLWRVEIPEYNTAVIPSPVYNGGMVYVTAGYNAGCTGIKLTRDGEGVKAEKVYANKNMVNQHGGVVLVDGHIYGFKDQMGLVCQNLATGETVWRERKPELVKGVVTAVGDRLIVQNERDGLLAVLAASPEGWKEFGRMEFPERTETKTIDNMIWVHPVVAGGKLYLRDHDLLFCYDLKK